MTCTAFGNPKPIVTWLKEGTLLGASGKYQVGVPLVGPLPTLLPPPSLCLFLPLQGRLPLHMTSGRGTKGEGISRRTGWGLLLEGDEK